jgi:hypothetical protein
MLAICDVARFVNLRVIVLLSWALMTFTMVHSEPRTIRIEESEANVIYTASLMANETDLKQLAHLVVDVRDLLSAQGHELPILKPFLTHCRALACDYGVFINDDEFDALKREFDNYEQADPFSRNLKKVEQDSITLSSKAAIGLLKFMGGSLLCLVPMPIAQGVGASLAILGINDMLNL